MTESELSELLSRLNRAVTRCVCGKTSFEQFVEEYGYPVGEYALDGHEASDEERAVLSAWKAQIAPHIAITEQILNKLCSSEDAAKPVYQVQGRFGPDVAKERLREIAFAYAIKEARTLGSDQGN